MGKYACLLLLAAAAAACNTSEKTSTVEVEEPASAVTEYTPAPGQFINSTDAGFGDRTITTPEEAVAYAEERLSRGLYVSLGGWGGYIVAEFDEPVANTGGYDLYVTGNAFDGSSEPGVVWVAVRENGAPGTWYRLRGSEDDNDETLYDYEATYAPSDEEGIAAEWHDNRDGKGTIDRIGVHSQASYVPAWVPSLHLPRRPAARQRDLRRGRQQIHHDRLRMGLCRQLVRDRPHGSRRTASGSPTPWMRTGSRPTCRRSTT